MKKEKMNLTEIEEMLNNYDIPEIETVEENIMKAISAKKIKPKISQIILAPIIGYLVSLFLFVIFYSRNAIVSFLWDLVGNKIIDFIHLISRLSGILSTILPPFRAEYLVVPLTGMFIISIGTFIMEKKNNKKGGNR